MATSLVKIGNSRGVRIPKNVIEQLHLGEGQVALEVRKGCLLIKPVKKPAKRAATTNGQGVTAVAKKRVVTNGKPEAAQATKRVRDPAWLKYMRNLPVDDDIDTAYPADKAMKPRCFAVYSVNPARAARAKTVRRGYPCVVLSPNEHNADPNEATVFVAPVAEGVASPSRVSVRFDSKDNMIFFDYFQAIRKGCLLNRLGDLNRGDARRVANAFRDKFAARMSGV